MALLFVGDPKAGKKTLAKAMLQEPWKVLTKIHTTAALPLPEDASRSRIDFLVFFVDMTNAKSLSNLKTRLLKVDKDYFAQGRSCIVATRVDLNRSHAFTTEHLEAVTNVYGMPVFYCNLTKREQLQNLSVRVYKAAELANGFIPYISPLIFAP